MKLYYDLRSQPARAIYIFLKANNIPYTDELLDLREGEHFSEEFTKVNRFQKVPAIDDNGFVLRESVVILKYLTAKYKLADHWYPSDFEQQIRVDEYLHWHHSNTRLNAATIFRSIVLEPRRTGNPIDWKRVEHFRGELSKTLDHLENVFLNEGPYLCNQPSISICDILGVCELMQLNVVHGEQLYESNATIRRWVERVKRDLYPHFDEAHERIYGARAVFDQTRSKL